MVFNAVQCKDEDRIAWFLRRFFCFWGVVGVVIIVFVVIAVIVVGGARPRAPRLELSAIALASAHRSPAPNLAAKSLNVPSVRQLSEETLR